MAKAGNSVPCQIVDKEASGCIYAISLVLGMILPKCHGDEPKRQGGAPSRRPQRDRQGTQFLRIDEISTTVLGSNPSAPTSNFTVEKNPTDELNGKPKRVLHPNTTKEEHR